MAVLKRQNVCFGTKYTDNAGQEKTRWVTVGKAFHSDRGGISIKFDTIPAGGCRGGRRRTPATCAPEAENNEEQL